MSLYEEFDEFYNEIGPRGTAAYKFFDSFKFNKEEKTISFHKDFVHTLDDLLFEDLRSYIKQEKSTITKLKKSMDIKMTKYKMAFFFIKLQELGIFTTRERQYIMIYSDFSLDILQ
jgi:hypothetical protein